MRPSHSYGSQTRDIGGISYYKIALGSFSDVAERGQHGRQTALIIVRFRPSDGSSRRTLFKNLLKQDSYRHDIAIRGPSDARKYTLKEASLGVDNQNRVLKN